MDAAPVSVVVASRDRPGDLSRCLTALGQQTYRPFEIVVAADAQGIAAAKAHPLGPNLKTVLVEDANISIVRNAGIARAAGKIVAFIDDDACAAPTWLHHLTAAFSDSGVAAAAGMVLGRNGISVQWGPRLIGRDAHHVDVDLRSAEPVVFDPFAVGAFKTEGTNCAFRRDRLVELGGFDPSYRFFLDDADLNLRMAATGARTGFAPLAVVQHGFAPSRFRRSDRVPRDLTEIGASLAVFLERHCPAEDRDRALSDHRREQRDRLLRHMVDGRIEPRDVARLMDGFERGLGIGRSRAPATAPLGDSGEAFRGLPEEIRPRAHVALCCRPFDRSRQLEAARRSRADGNIVSLFCLSRSALFHSVRMTDDGIWMQSGGILGKSVRTQPLLRRTGYRSRFDEEVARVRTMRDIP